MTYFLIGQRGNTIICGVERKETNKGKGTESFENTHVAYKLRKEGSKSSDDEKRIGPGSDRGTLAREGEGEKVNEKVGGGDRRKQEVAN